MKPIQDPQPLPLGQGYSFRAEDLQAIAREIIRQLGLQVAGASFTDSPTNQLLTLDPPRDEFWAKLTAEGTGTNVGRYSWIEQQRSATGSFTDLTYSRTGTFDQNPAIETNGIQGIPTGNTTPTYVYLRRGFPDIVNNILGQEYLFEMDTSNLPVVRVSSTTLTNGYNPGFIQHHNPSANPPNTGYSDGAACWIFDVNGNALVTGKYIANLQEKGNSPSEPIYAVDIGSPTGTLKVKNLSGSQVVNNVTTFTVYPDNNWSVTPGVAGEAQVQRIFITENLSTFPGDVTAGSVADTYKIEFRTSSFTVYKSASNLGVAYVDLNSVFPSIWYHNLLSVVHPDTTPYTPPVLGDMIAGYNTGKWTRVPPNSDATYLNVLAEGPGATFPAWVRPAIYVSVSGGALRGPEPVVNFIPDSTCSCAITATDNPAQNRVDVQISVKPVSVRLAGGAQVGTQLSDFNFIGTGCWTAAVNGGQPCWFDIQRVLIVSYDDGTSSTPDIFQIAFGKKDFVLNAANGIANVFTRGATAGGVVLGANNLRIIKVYCNPTTGCIDMDAVYDVFQDGLWQGTTAPFTIQGVC